MSEPEKNKIKMCGKGITRRRAQRRKYMLNCYIACKEKGEKTPVDENEGAEFYPPNWVNFPNPENERKYGKKKEKFCSNDNDETEVNGINALPIVSQLKSAVLFVSGNREEAKKVQSDFVTTCPGVSQVTSLVQLAKGDSEGAKKSFGRFCNFMNGTVNSIPVIGHVKGAYHYATGNKDAGNEALLAATRTAGVMAGGVLGIAGGQAGGLAGGIAAGMKH